VVRNLPTGLSYILRHCGTPEELSDLPADAAGSPVFVVPVKKWSSGLTTTYTFLEELDLISHAVVVDDTYMSSACGQKLVAGAASPRVAFLSAPGAYSGVYNDCPFGGYEIKVLQGYKEHLVSYGGGTSFDPAVAARWCSLTEGCSSYICPNATSMKKVRTDAACRGPLFRVAHRLPERSAI